MNWTNKEKEILIEKYPKQGVRIPELLITHSKLGIRRKARRFDLNYNGEKYKLKKEIIITHELKDMVDGLLLGDGGFVKGKRYKGNSKTAHLEIGQTEKRKEWLHDIKKRFNNLNVTTSEVRLWHKGGVKKILGNMTTQADNYCLATWNYVQFKNEMEKWGYKIKGKGKDTIPEDTSVSPLTLALWYMGDGCLGKSGGRYSLQFATLCFNKESIIYYKNKIEKEYGIGTKIYRRKSDNNHLMHISKREDIIKFLEMTEEYSVPCFNYKWDALRDENWLEVKRKDFSDDEIEKIKNNYQTNGPNILGLEGRSKATITRKANELGIVKTHGIWTDEEIKILKKEYPVHGRNIPELFDNHTKLGIFQKAQKLGVGKEGIKKISEWKRWSQKHISILKEKYPKDGTNIPELIEVFDRKTIWGKAKALNIIHNL